jgi:WD40 repeat protein
MRKILAGLFIVGSLWLGGCAHTSPDRVLAPEMILVSAVAPHGERVAVVEKNGLYLARAQDLRRRQLISSTALEATDLSWSPKGRELVFWTGGQLWIWRGRKAELLWQVHKESMSHPIWVWRTFWDPDGSLLAIKSTFGRKDEIYEVGGRGSAGLIETRLCHGLDLVQKVAIGGQWVAVVSRDDHGDAIDFCIRKGSRNYGHISTWHWRIQDHRIGAIAFERGNGGLYASVQSLDGETTLYFLDIARKLEDKGFATDAEILAIQPSHNRVWLKDKDTGKILLKPL